MAGSFAVVLEMLTLTQTLIIKKRSAFFSLLFKVPFGPFANGLALHPVSYRWMTAFVGAWMPLLVVWIGCTILWFVGIIIVIVVVEER